MELILRSLTPYVLPCLVVVYPIIRIIQLLPGVQEPHKIATLRTIIFIAISYFMLNRYTHIEYHRKEFPKFTFENESYKDSHITFLRPKIIISIISCQRKYSHSKHYNLPAVLFSKVIFSQPAAPYNLHVFLCSPYAVNLIVEYAIRLSNTEHSFVAVCNFK